MRVLHEWLLTAERVAVHLPTRTAVVADLHLGYAEARRRRGDAVPAESVPELLEPLRRVKRQHAIRNLIVAGDLLEDGDCHEALTAFLHWLDQNNMDRIVVVPGNHDRGLELLPAAHSRLALHPQGVLLGDWRIMHDEGALPDAPIVHGHDHPCLRWSPKSRTLRPRFTRSRSAPCAIEAPCYLIGPQRLILPAFSQEAAGVNILSIRRWRGLHCRVIADDRLLDMGEVATLGKLSRRN